MRSSLFTLLALMLAAGCSRPLPPPTPSRLAAHDASAVPAAQPDVIAAATVTLETTSPVVILAPGPESVFVCVTMSSYSVTPILGALRIARAKTDELNAALAGSVGAYETLHLAPAQLVNGALPSTAPFVDVVTDDGYTGDLCSVDFSHLVMIP